MLEVILKPKMSEIMIPLLQTIADIRRVAENWERGLRRAISCTLSERPLTDKNPMTELPCEKWSLLERFRAGMALSQRYVEHNLYRQIVDSHAHTSRIS